MRAASASDTACRGSPVFRAVSARLQRRRMANGWVGGMADREEEYEVWAAA